MELFGKNKGKKSPVTRGLSDYHSHSLHSQFSSSSSSSSEVSMLNHASSIPPSLSPASSGPPLAVPYEAPLHVENSGPQEVTFVAGGNENMEGEQEIDEVEVLTTSNGVNSSISWNNVSKMDFKIGNNINRGRSQKVDKVKFGNAG